MDFYYIDMSPPCRAVMLTAKSLGVKLNKKVVNLMAGDHKKPEFAKINPQTCVPTIVDGNFALWESRAIQTYLVNKYGKDDSLYPSDPVERAKVDRMLYFDMGTLFTRVGAFIRPVLFGGEKPCPEKHEKILEALGMLDGFLKGQNFVAGNKVTVADHSIVATVSTLKEDNLFELKKYPNIAGWLHRCEKEIPGYETENAVGAKKHGEFMGPKLAL